VRLLPLLLPLHVQLLLLMLLQGAWLVRTSAALSSNNTSYDSKSSNKNMHLSRR